MEEFSKEEFFNGVLKKVKSGAGYLESIIDYHEKYDIEIEVLSTLIRKNPEFKKLLELESKKKFLIKND